jgi:hypothetical protein
LRSSKTFAQEAIAAIGLKSIGPSQFLQYGAEQLKSNKALVLEAVRREPWALEHASEHLRNDKSFVKDLVVINA